MTGFSNVTDPSSMNQRAATDARKGTAMDAMRHCNRTVVRLGLAAFAWSMLFVWQGLDFTDMGFWLAGYQQFYTHPETGWTACWLSNFIGHWTGSGLGGGILAYRLGYVAVITTSAVLTYQLLAARIGGNRTLAAMVFLTVCFTRTFGGNWIGYNDLTALFYLAGAALLFHGLVGNRKILVVLSGVVLGANIFIRLPNLAGMALVAAIWLHAWSNRMTWRSVLADSAGFGGGMVLGAVCVWGLIVLHGHQDVYCQSIQAVFGEAGSSNAPHSGSGMLRSLIHNHVRAFGMALPLLVFGGWIASRVSRQKIPLAAVVVAAGAWLLVLALYHLGYWPWILAGLCYVVLSAIVFREFRKDRDLCLLAFMAGMVLFLTPLGSTNGMTNAIFGLWLALPLALTWLWRGADFTIGRFSITARGLRVFTMTLVLALGMQSLASAWRYTYLDSNNRLAMSHSITHPRLLGTYTTEDRARVVTELLDAMSRFTKPGDAMCAYNGIPAVYFLTDTYPWLGISWPDFGGADKIAALIRKKELTAEKLPCIVRATGSTYANSWPVAAKPPATFWHQDEPRRVFGEFEKRHGYVVAWSNDFFEILTSVK